MAWVGFFGFWENVVMLTSVCVCVYYVVLCSFMVIIFRSLGWHYLIILVMLLLKMILQFSARNSQIFFML